MSIANSSVASTDSSRAHASGAAVVVKSLATVRIWPAAILVLTFWVFYVVVDYAEMSMGFRFLSRFGFYGILLLVFLAWWLAFSRTPWKDRLLALGAMIVGTAAAGLLADKKSTGNMGAASVFLVAFPFLISTWTLWLAACKWRWGNFSPLGQRVGLCVVIVATLGCFDLVRWEGLSGNQRAQFAWRWASTSEEKFLAEHRSTNSNAESAAPVLRLQPGDWPEFRGPGRDDQIHGLKLATDWTATPPKQIWKQRVGPAWSSVSIVDGRLFTQEQRGEKEAVVCYDAATGKEIWAHEDQTRFEDPLSGAGPRGTPTFSEGRIYSLGGTGQLNCLDATAGKVIWAHDVAKDADAEVKPGGFGMRQWGYSNSPLVVDGKVIVFAGGTHKKGLLAYQAENGEPAWHYAAGDDGYSSPQLVSLQGQRQLLIHSNQGLAAVNPTSGTELWNQPCAAAMFLPIAQPQPVSDSQVLAQSENGIQCIRLTDNAGRFSSTQQWDSKSLKASLNDFVVHDGCIYGFDDGVFCCLDLETGKRNWKAGRYGHGQVLLLADQPLLIAMTEDGEAVLISPNAKKLEELARSKIIEGKTWNHPVIAHGRLYARNAEEMACYELPLAKSAPGDSVDNKN